jgi:tRNA threonylcarbamoyladenosine biosynthesis protein TsaB
MPILALDTALDSVSVAIVDDQGRLAAVRRSDDRRSGAEQLLPLVEAARAEAGLAYADLDSIGVTVGPGSFTGIRVGLAAARGLALATGIRLVGVTTLAAVAQAAVDAIPGLTAVMATIDARRGELYCQRFDVAAGAIATIAGEAPALLPVAAVLNKLELGDSVVGSGAGLVTGTRGPFDRLTSEAAAVAKLVGAIDAGRFPAMAPRPLYLRAPDARLPVASSDPPR